MTLLDGLSRGQLLKMFASLGPYLRESKCQQEGFFFDCLAVCANTKPAPDVREFWGWWSELSAKDDHFVYQYWFGLFNKQGEWKCIPCKNDTIKQQVEANLSCFYQRLEAVMHNANLTMVPVGDPALTTYTNSR